MPAERFVEQLNVQIGHEFAAHQQYIACGVFYGSMTMPRTADFMYRQSALERDHALRMIAYLVEQGAPVTVPAVAAPTSDFDEVIAPVELAVEQERRVTAQMHELTKIAREESDFASDQFMQQFVRHQVDQVARMTALLAVVRRSANLLESIEQYVSRELAGAA